MEQALVKRKWCYLRPPKIFGIPPCKCGNRKIQWSEWENHVWCNQCQIDFIPEHNGIFDGPIPIHCAGMLGMTFDRFNLITGIIDVFDPDTVQWAPYTKQTDAVCIRLDA